LNYSIALPKLGKEPPSELCLLKWGLNPARPLPLFLTKESANDIIKKFQENGNTLPWDIDHSSVDSTIPVSERDAIGCFNLQLRDDGIWAVDIQWTEQGDEKVRSGKFMYYSPSVQQIDIGIGHIVCEIKSAAITNYPRMKKLKPLLMSENQTPMTTMNMNLLPDEELYSRVRPIKKMQQGASSLMNDVQAFMSSYNDTSNPLMELSKMMSTSLPSWLEQLNMLIEQLDPDGLTEMGMYADQKQGAVMKEPVTQSASFSEAAKSPVQEKQEPSKEVTGNYSSLYETCKKMTGKSDVDEIIGTLLAQNQNQKSLSNELEVSHKNEIELMVTQGIKDGLIPAHEREDFIKLPKKAISMHLSMAMPLPNSIKEKIETPTNPSDVSVPAFVKESVQNIFKKASER